MQKLREWIMVHIEAVITGIITLLFGGILSWWKGFRDGSRRSEKKLMRTQEALRKSQAQYSALMAKDRKNERKKAVLEKQIHAYQARIVELETRLGQQ